MDIPEGKSAVQQCLLDLKHSLAMKTAPSDVEPALPTCAHFEGRAVPNSQVSSIESGSGEIDVTTDSESIDRCCFTPLDTFIHGPFEFVVLVAKVTGGAASDENLDGSRKFFVDVEGIKVPYELKSCVM